MVGDITGDLDSKQLMFVSGASIALGEIGRYGALPSKDVHADVLKLIETAKTTKDIKTQEYAIASLGYIGVGNPDQVPDILTFLYDFGPKQTKQTEVNFTIGEAIACIGAGWKCSVMDVFADVADKEPARVDIDPTVMSEILSTILDEMGTSPKATTKKSASIWLLSLVKFCSTHPSVRVYMTSCYSPSNLVLPFLEQDSLICVPFTSHNIGSTPEDSCCVLKSSF
jgi:proteasome component ECM29